MRFDQLLLLGGVMLSVGVALRDGVGVDGVVVRGLRLLSLPWKRYPGCLFDRAHATNKKSQRFSVSGQLSSVCHSVPAILYKLQSLTQAISLVHPPA